MMVFVCVSVQMNRKLKKKSVESWSSDDIQRLTNHESSVRVSIESIIANYEL